MSRVNEVNGEIYRTPQSNNLATPMIAAERF